MNEKQTGFSSIDRPWLKFYESALTDKDIPLCSAYRLMFENNKNRLDEVALVYFNRKITFRDFFAKIEAAASAFRKLGICKGDIVTLQVLGMPQTVILFYALSYIGAVANIVFFTATESEVEGIVRETSTRMYITLGQLWPKYRSAVRKCGVQHVLILDPGEEADIVVKTVLSLKKGKRDASTMSWKEFLKSGTGDIEEVNEAELPVAMVYTSGTTGKSKAVVLSNRSMNSLVLQYAKTYTSLRAGGLIMNSLPPFIAFGLVCSLHVPLCLGVTNAIVLDPTATSAGKWFAKYRPNYFINGKAAVENIIHDPKVAKMDLGFLEILAAGGDAMPVAFEEEVNSFLKERGSSITLSIGYGMSEVAATVVTATPMVYKTGTVGIPLPGTIVKIVKPDTENELPYNTDGEVCFNAPTMMLGYYKQKEETGKVIRRHRDGLMWVHSGDIGRIDEEGFVSIVGRIKRMILVQMDGLYHKLFPKLVEDRFIESGLVSEMSIVGRSNPDVENELVAFVVSREGDGEEALSRLKEFAKENLEPWERPVEYRFLDSLPLTAVGKVNYRKLEDSLQH